MHITVNDVKLFVEVVGAKLAPTADQQCERPTILLLHGGPGLDHSVFFPALQPLSEVAQLVCYDHRGCGRSDDGPREFWKLDQWAADAASVIHTLGLDKPIVLGTSFGGFVAQRLASQYPDLLSGLVLMSTVAKPDIPQTLGKIAEAGGEKARSAAELFFTGNTDPEILDRYFELCLPLYTINPMDMEAIARIHMRLAVLTHFFRKEGEMHTVNLHPDLAEIGLPTLIVHGENDPVFPIDVAREMLHTLENTRRTDGQNKQRIRFTAMPGCGHLSEQDAPHTIISEIVEFFRLQK